MISKAATFFSKFNTYPLRARLAHTIQSNATIFIGDSPTSDGTESVLFISWVEGKQWECFKLEIKIALVTINVKDVVNLSAHIVKMFIRPTNRAMTYLWPIFAVSLFGILHTLATNPLKAKTQINIVMVAFLVISLLSQILSRPTKEDLDFIIYFQHLKAVRWLYSNGIPLDIIYRGADAVYKYCEQRKETERQFVMLIELAKKKKEN